ncbi:MAG: hypothetical protein A3J38_01045 [Gammaproteobacteria bacterium RIFCSPHIGHO2_12_FULL_45_9]|nr:MAG: hypothetical protein A3J38_01045 [Gammaproteobacteria bacterium RIFCSPHIGHO2_12_FULL_45_9]
MLRHIVLYTYRDSCSDAEIADIYQELDRISSALPGRISYTWGKYQSHEGRNKGYTHALITDFIDEQARNLFIDDPLRIEFSQREVLPRMVNGVDSIVSFDFEWLA